MIKLFRFIVPIFILLVVGIVSYNYPTHPIVAIDNPVKISATLIPYDENFKLIIETEIANGYHIYSVNQQEGGPLATKITIDKNNLIKITEEPPPTINYNTVWPGLKILTLTKHVVWSMDLQSSNIVRGTVKVSPCTENFCLLPQEIPFIAEVIQ